MTRAVAGQAQKHACTTPPSPSPAANLPSTPPAMLGCKKAAGQQVAHEYLSVFASPYADVVLPPTAGSLAQAVAPPTAGTHAHNLRVGVAAYENSVAELVAAAPSSEGQAEPILSQYCCHCTRVRVKGTTEIES